MEKIISSILTSYAKAYSLTTQIRATDLLRNVPGTITTRSLFRQSIAEHNYMTSTLISLILLKLNGYLSNNNFVVQDPFYAAFMGLHHDDDEWEFGDMVPSLKYGCNTQFEKSRIGANAIYELFGYDQYNFAIQAYHEYEDRITPTSQLVKTCDILDLFCHNRILLCFGIGLITEQNYLEFAPETHVESREFLDFFGRSTSSAEILEYKYIQKYEALNFPPALNAMFHAFQKAISNFDFRLHIKNTSPHS